MHDYNGRLKVAVYLKPSEYTLLTKNAGEKSYSEYFRDLLLNKTNWAICKTLNCPLKENVK